MNYQNIFNMTTDLESLRAENKLFREMLAFNFGGANLYCDDGELQDSSERPFIDFRLDSAVEIQDKIRERNLNYFRENPHPMVHIANDWPLPEIKVNEDGSTIRKFA